MVSDNATEVSVYPSSLFQNHYILATLKSINPTLQMSFQVPEAQKKVITEEKITIITQREESPPAAGIHLDKITMSFLQASLIACLCLWVCLFCVHLPS